MFYRAETLPAIQRSAFCSTCVENLEKVIGRPENVREFDSSRENVTAYLAYLGEVRELSERKFFPVNCLLLFSSLGVLTMFRTLFSLLNHFAQYCG